MARSIDKKTMSFLGKLKKNNNRDWFNANKNLYVDALADFTGVVEEVIKSASKFDKSVSGIDPKKAVFRIYRDTRFSKDKTPYKTHMAARIHKPGKAVCGYYMSVAPNDSWIAGGTWQPEPPKLLKIRKKISRNAKEWTKIVESAAWKKTFSKPWEGHGDDRLKTAPKGFEKDDPMVEYLKNKHFIVSHKVPDSVVTSAKLIPYLTKIMKQMGPYHEFLNKA